MLQRSDSEAEVERHMPPAAQAGDLASARLLILVKLRCSEVKPLVMKKEKKRASVTKPHGKVGFCHTAHRYFVFELSFFDFSGVSSVSTMKVRKAIAKKKVGFNPNMLCGFTLRLKTCLVCEASSKSVFHAVGNISQARVLVQKIV